MEVLGTQGRVVEGGAVGGASMVQLSVNVESVAVTSSHYDGVKVASHEHGSILGVEVEVAGREERRQVSSGFLRLLQPVAVRVRDLGGRILLVLGLDGGGQLGVADHHPLVALHLWLHPEDKALPSAKEAELVASSLAFLPICREEGPTHIAICGPDE